MFSELNAKLEKEHEFERLHIVHAYETIIKEKF